jgi:hypothetical protein
MDGVPLNDNRPFTSPFPKLPDSTPAVDAGHVPLNVERWTLAQATSSDSSIQAYIPVPSVTVTMTFHTRNAYYLRISSNNVLPLYVRDFTDNQQNRL